MRRRTAAIAVSLATTVAGLSGAVAPAAAEEEAVACRSEVFGVADSGRLVYRRLDDGRAINAKRTTKPLPFRPTNVAGVGYQQLRGGQRDFILATTPDGRPRMIASVRRAGQRNLRTRVERFRTTGFTPRLMAAGYNASRVVTVEGTTVKQYRIRRNRQGRLVILGARVAKTRVGRLTTLSWFNRVRLDGKLQNVFFATTKAGALKQIRVPVRRPADTTVRIVKRRGFRPVTGLSPGLCDDGTTGMLVGVMAGRDKARWYTLEQPYRPAARNLTAQGLAAPRANWRLRPTM